MKWEQDTDQQSNFYLERIWKNFTSKMDPSYIDITENRF